MFQKSVQAFGALFLLLAAWISCSTAAETTENEAKLDASYREMLDVWLRARIETLGIPGLAIAVVHDQDVIYQGCFGYADVAARNPVTPKTQFRIASQSKLITAPAIMRFRNAGKLRLDAPLSEYLAGPPRLAGSLLSRQFAVFGHTPMMEGGLLGHGGSMGT